MILICIYPPLYAVFNMLKSQNLCGKPKPKHTIRKMWFHLIWIALKKTKHCSVYLSISQKVECDFSEEAKRYCDNSMPLLADTSSLLAMALKSMGRTGEGNYFFPSVYILLNFAPCAYTYYPLKKFNKRSSWSFSVKV